MRLSCLMGLVWTHNKSVDARSCSLVLVSFAGAHCIPAHFTSPRCFLDFPVEMKTPLACRDAPAPAAAPARSSRTASRNARRCRCDRRRRSVTRSLDARGARTRRWCVSLPSHPVAALARAAVAAGPATRALFAFGDGQASPRSQPFGPHSSRPQEGRAVRMMPLPTAAMSGSGREDKATVTGRFSGRSLALSGGSWSHGAVTGPRAGLSRCVPGRALRK